MDLVCPVGIATGAGKQIPDKMLVLPVVAYGYTGHVMDFPGTIKQLAEDLHDLIDMLPPSRARVRTRALLRLSARRSRWPGVR